MPTTFKIAAHTERRCEPCEFLKRTNMICSRLDGIKCDYLCMNSKCYGDLPVSKDETVAAKQISMRIKNAGHGRMIGKQDIQPSWCPLLNPPTLPKTTHQV